MNATLRILGRISLLAALPCALLADVPAVPEMDPGTAASALTLLSGLALVARGRKRR